MTGNLLLQGLGLRTLVPAPIPPLSAPALRKPAGGEAGHRHPTQQHGFGLFLQLPIRKTLGESRAEGLHHTSRTCSSSLFSMCHSVPCPEPPRVTAAQRQLGQHLSWGNFRKKKKNNQKLEDKFGPEDGVNPKTFCRSVSAAYRKPRQTLPPGVNYFKIDSSWRAPAHKYPQILPHPVCIIASVLWWERTRVNDWLTMSYFSNFMQFSSFPCILH